MICGISTPITANRPVKIGPMTAPSCEIASPVCETRPKKSASPACAPAVCTNAASCPVMSRNTLISSPPILAPAPSTVTRIDPTLPTMPSRSNSTAFACSRNAVSCPDSAMPWAHVPNARPTSDTAWAISSAGPPAPVNTAISPAPNPPRPGSSAARVAFRSPRIVSSWATNRSD